MFDQSKTIGTSLNQVPAQVKIIDWEKHKKDMVLDYGAGRYPNLVQNHLKKEGVKWVESYDPYNPDISAEPEGEFDVIICSNVLNVIAHDLDLDNVVMDISDKLHETGTAYIQIYTGDRSGESKETTRGWQRNSLLAHYLPVINKYFLIVQATANRFILTVPLK
jgi:hypothetical protein